MVTIVLPDRVAADDPHDRHEDARALMGAWRSAQT
jgi:hypothetical protein